MLLVISLGVLLGLGLIILGEVNVYEVGGMIFLSKRKAERFAECLNDFHKGCAELSDDLEKIREELESIG